MKFNKSLLYVVAIAAMLALGSGLAFARDTGGNELEDAIKALHKGSSQVMATPPGKPLPTTCEPMMMEGQKGLEKSDSPNAKKMLKGQQMMMDGRKMMLDGNQMVLEGKKGMDMEMKQK